MTELKKDAVSLEELIVSTLAMADAVAKPLIEKGVIFEAELKQTAERATHVPGLASEPKALLKRLTRLSPPGQPERNSNHWESFSSQGGSVR